MPRYLVDLEVESESKFADGASILQSHLEGIEVSITRRESESTADYFTLALQLIFEAEDLFDARERGVQSAEILLCAWSLATGVALRLRQTVRIVDWTIGLRDRQGVQFSRHGAGSPPHAILNTESLQTAVRIAGASLSERLRRAVRWFSHGVSAGHPDDQFSFFWLAIELLAAEARSVTPVPDACPKCRGPLFCRACEVEPVHRPYPKQAIQDLFRHHVTTNHEEFFKHANRFRNALMHGDDVRDVEHELGVKFEEVVNCLGRLATAASHAALAVSLAQRGECGTLSVTLAENFVPCDADVGVFFTVRSRDPEHPSASDIPRVEVSIEAAQKAT